MKTCIKKSLAVPVVVAVLSSVLAGQVTAQTLTVLHEFTALDTNNVNSDGVNPSAGLVLSGNTLFGTTLAGGVSGGGTVFAMNVDGTGFRTLHNFAGNGDGAGPSGILSLSGDTLYGTTLYGGASNMGTIFALKTNGAGYVVLHAFAQPIDHTMYGTPINEEGAYPQGRLVVSSNAIYGAASNGGRYGDGTVFRLNLDGSGFTNLHSFGAGYPSEPNSDGAQPKGVLLLGNAFVRHDLFWRRHFFWGKCGRYSLQAEYRRYAIRKSSRF
jgi:uncharacterized repeat protein (TIGR03803 family)